MQIEELHPDSLYRTGSQTFFYNPERDELFIQAYPATHQDMLASDRKLFRSVYRGIDTSRMYLGGESRSPAMKHGHAILGRIGMQPSNPHEIVVAFWTKPSNAVLGKFFDALFQKYPAFKGMQNSIVVARAVSPGAEESEVEYFTDIFGGDDNPEKTVDFDQFKSNADPNEKFQIGGHTYTYRDLESMRKILHNRPNDRGVLSVLCHPDVKSNKKLKGFTPASCNIQSPPSPGGPANWRAKGREKGHPYLYSYGEFTSWMKYQDLFLS